MLRKILYNWFGRVDALHVGYDNAAYGKPAVVFVHGIGSSGAMWQRVITSFEHRSDVRIIAVDLLGFGDSPKPEWAKYHTIDHAKALAMTLRRRKIGKCIIVGHSLGALVAIEYAKLFPKQVISMILCSPPFYRMSERKRANFDVLYAKLYRKVREREDRTLRLGRLLQERVRPGRGFMLNETTLPAFMKSLEASIEGQTSLTDIRRLLCPIMIFYGTLDPIVLARNIKYAAKDRPNIKVQNVMAGHEINERYAKSLLKALEGHLEAAYPKANQPR